MTKMKTDKSLIERIREGLGVGLDVLSDAGIFESERISKHSIGRSFRSTKAYADDRQKALHNRRKNGLRRRRN